MTDASNFISDALNASVDLYDCRRNFIGLWCGIRSIVQRKTLLLGFYWNPAGLEPAASWFRCEHLTKVL